MEGGGGGFLGECSFWGEGGRVRAGGEVRDGGGGWGNKFADIASVITLCTATKYDQLT